ncbi:MAG: cysteine desulfurase [Clostridia bacterium]|nr:cysteine desulfurase [Clostridia bacterium]
MIYLDSAATTKVLPEAAKAAVKAMTEEYANPSSLHSFGYEAEKIREKARETVAAAAGVKDGEIVFTSGGSGADNLAIFGCLKNKKGGRIITSAYEHPAVLECFRALSPQFETVYLKPEDGIITPDTLKNALTPDTLLVSIMHVNNETGALNPIKELAKVTKDFSDALFHTDAVQGFLKENASYSCCDMASFSAHKTGAPKGIGALYVKKDVRLKPLIYGGGQEKGLFCGTENVPAAAAWTEAVKILLPSIDSRRKKADLLKKKTQDILLSLGAVIISPKISSPHIVTAAFDGYISENIVHFLEKKEIYVSTGSACSSKKASATFSAIGMEKYSSSSLRISFADDTEKNDIDIFASALEEALKTLKRKQ